MQPPQSSEHFQLAPPPPPRRPSGGHNKPGQELLDLVRQWQRQQKNNSDADGGRAAITLQMLVDTLQALVKVTCRRGLLQHDTAQARQLMTTMNTAKKSVEPATSRHQRRQRREAPPPAASSNNESTSTDAHLMLQAMIRILEESNKSNVAGGANATDDAILLVSLVADCITGSVQHFSSNDSVCGPAEYELLCSHGRSLLQGLLVTLRLEMVPDTHDRDNRARHATTRGLCAGTALVRCLGARMLSRHTALLASWRQASERVMLSTMSSPTMAAAAALLWAALPWAGNAGTTDGSSNNAPGDWNATQQWSDMWQDVLQAMSVLAGSLLEKQSEKSYSTLFVPALIQQVQQCNIENERASLVLTMFHKLMALVKALFHCVSLNSLVEINVMTSLDVTEQLLSLPLAAETQYFGARKRLRAETTNGGLLSPMLLTEHVALPIATMGHELLCTLLTAVPTPHWRPHTRRLWHVAHGALLTTASLAVRQAVNPGTVYSSGSGGATQQRRWLHGSLVVRERAVQSLTAMFGTVGVPAQTMQPSSRGAFGTAIAATEMEKSLQLVVGTLLEQWTPLIIVGNTDENAEDAIEWGSPSERSKLISTCCACLAACLRQGGQYLTLSMRELLDSVLQTCLTDVMTFDMEGRSAMLPAVLNWATAAVAVPWPDGAKSSLVDMCRRVALLLHSAHDTDNVASHLLATCHATSLARAPALKMVTRGSAAAAAAATVDLNFNSMHSTASIMFALDKARVEMRKAAEKHAAQDADATEPSDMRPQKKARSDRTPATAIATTVTDTPATSNAASFRPATENPAPDVALKAPTEGSPHASDARSAVEQSPQPVERSSTPLALQPVHEAERKEHCSEADESESDFPVILDEGGPDRDDEHDDDA